jgi:hypothetical protein
MTRPGSTLQWHENKNKNWGHQLLMISLEGKDANPPLFGSLDWPETPSDELKFNPFQQANRPNIDHNWPFEIITIVCGAKDS